MNLTYIDLFLMHSPIAYKRFSKTNSSPEPASIDDVDLFPVDANGKTKRADVDYLDTWRAMEKLVKSGKVRSIGVSNFNSEQVERVCQNAEIKPVANEVECHPNLNQRKMIKFLADRNISLIAYSPLGKANFANKALAISNQQVKNIADKYAKTPAQVVLRYTVNIHQTSNRVYLFTFLFFFFQFRFKMAPSLFRNQQIKIASKQTLTSSISH